jgi:hypothetical protein
MSRPHRRLLCARTSEALALHAIVAVPSTAHTTAEPNNKRESEVRIGREQHRFPLKSTMVIFYLAKTVERNAVEPAAEPWLGQPQSDPRASSGFDRYSQAIEARGGGGIGG